MVEVKYFFKSEKMTKDCVADGKIDRQPVISVQSDWDDVIFASNQEIWISYKFLGEESVQSELRSHGTTLPSCNSCEFSVISLTQNSLTVKYNPTSLVYSFVPPSKTFSKIHKKKILSLDVTDGGLGISVCLENKLTVWNAVSGEVKKILSGHIGTVYKCKFFPSGIVVLTGGADMQLKIWSAETGNCPVTLIGHKGAINDFCIIDKGRNIVSVSRDGTAKLWDCGKSNCLATVFECSDDSFNCCSITILPKSIKVTREEPVNDREIGTSNKILLIGTEKGFLHGIALFSRETIFTLLIDSAINFVSVLDDQIIIGCQSGRIEIYKLCNEIKPVKIYSESASPVLCGCTYKNLGCFIGRNDGSVTYYDCQKYSNKRISLTGSDFDPILDISCCDKKIFTGCRDGKIRMYPISEEILTV